jgi:CDP-L-myo-inositol myo-inositolphosphotransferase
MKCLIIASGRGTRLASKTGMKPLASLMGLPLIARVILQAQKAGLNDFYVVTGYNGERLRAYLDDFSRRRNMNITCLQNDEWDKENGLSVLRARDVINENFILLMSDHIFDGKIIKRLKNLKLGDDEVILTVDSNIEKNHFVDEDDVTKLFIKENKVVNIGKEIKDYNAFDTGIFLCSPALFKAIKLSVEDGDTTLSGGVRILAKRKKVRPFEVNGDFWIDVDDEAKLKQAEGHLLNVQTKKPSDGFVSRYINRPISTKITQLFLKTNLQPNHISLICFITAIIGAIFFFLGGYINLLAGAILAQISSIIDGCDGEIARLKFLESEFGAWFDAVLDRYTDAFLLFGLTYYTYQVAPNPIWLTIGFLAIIGSLINSYTADKYDNLMKGRGILYFRIGRDLRIFTLFLCCLFNQPYLALILIAAIMNIENIRRVVVVAKVCE